jgi:high-affinity nickel permease
MLGRYVMIVCALLAWISAVSVFGISKSVMHELAALVLVLIGAVFAVGADIVAAIERLASQPTPQDRRPVDDLRYG